LEEYNINYRVEGPLDGPPLLLVHGFGANVNHFRYQFETLPREGYRVFAVDLLGFGASDKPSNVQYSIELFAELLADFLQAMSPASFAGAYATEDDDNENNSSINDEQKPTQQQWMIAGNSIGGLCCLKVAEQLPNLIQGIVLFNCSGGMSGFRYEDVPIWLRPVLWAVQNIVLGPHMGSGFFENFKTRENVESILKQQGVYGDVTNVDDELLEILLGPSEDEGAEDVFLKVFAGPPGPTPESLLPSIQCPILALWGSDDPWTPVDGGMHPGTQFDRYCGEAGFTLEVLKGAGHCPHDECPDRVHAKMLPWMKQVREKATAAAEQGNR